MDHQDFFSSRFHYTFGPHEPTLRVRPGTSLRVICPDSDNELVDGSLLSMEQRQADRAGLLLAGNPMAGPIHVEGASPGDCLAVRIDDIELDREKGQTGLGYGHGLLAVDLLVCPEAAEAGESVPRRLYQWKIDPDRRTATLVNPMGSAPMVVPLNPFIGCIGICPKWGQSISTLYAGGFGGNMDLPLTCAGTTLYLPVQHEGALLMMGDIHAAQGHGEIIGGGIETSGKIRCTIDLIKSREIPAPRLVDDWFISAVGVAGELRAAVQQAYAHLLNWLVEEYGLNRWDGYNLISQAGSLVMGGLLMSPYAVAARIPLELIPSKDPHPNPPPEYQGRE